MWSDLAFFIAFIDSFVTIAIIAIPNCHYSFVR